MEAMGIAEVIDVFRLLIRTSLNVLLSESSER